MSYRDVNSAQRAIRRSFGIDVSDDTKTNTEAIMIGLLAGGRANEASLAFNMLEKMSAKGNIEDLLLKLLDKKEASQHEKEEATPGTVEVKLNKLINAVERQGKTVNALSKRVFAKNTGEEG